MNTQTTFTAAINNYESGHLKKARQLCQEILKYNPNLPGALHLLGLIAYKNGDNEIAANYIKRALKRRSDFPEAHYNLGNALNKLGTSLWRRLIATEKPYD